MPMHADEADEGGDHQDRPGAEVAEEMLEGRAEEVGADAVGAATRRRR